MVLAKINRKARIIICGAISQYNTTTPVKGPANYLSLLVNRARMEGIENLPEALLKLFNGENFGKLVLQVAKE